jgi:hypothetical protein
MRPNWIVHHVDEREVVHGIVDADRASTRFVDVGDAQTSTCGAHLGQRDVVGVDEVLQGCVDDVQQVGDPVVAGQDAAYVGQQGGQAVQTCRGGSNNGRIGGIANIG